MPRAPLSFRSHRRRVRMARLERNAPLGSRQVQRLNKRVNKLLAGIEVKYHDLQPISQTPTSTTGVVLNISDLDEGDTVLTRSGEKVHAKRVWFKGEITIHASASKTKVRCMVIRQKNNQVPAINGILQSGTINAPHSHQYRKLTAVLMDRTYVLNSVSNPMIQFNYNLKVDKNIAYSGAAGTDLADGSIYLVLISNEATNTPTVSGYSRLSFTDM